MTKADLRTGMFGLITYAPGNWRDNEDLFVIVGDKLVYRSGGFDDLDDLTDDLKFKPDITGEEYGQIDVLVEAVSFNQADEYTHFDKHPKIIWERGSEPKEDECLTPEFKKEFDNVAKAKRTVYQSFVDAGFTNEQAWELMNKSFEQAMVQNTMENLFGGLVK